jgi:hypothetical protein
MYIQINNFGGINATQGFVVLGKLDVTKTNASISERRIWSEHVIDWNSLVIPPQLNYCGDSLPCPGCGSASQMLDRGCRCTKEQALDWACCCLLQGKSWVVTRRFYGHKDYRVS